MSTSPVACLPLVPQQLTQTLAKAISGERAVANATEIFYSDHWFSYHNFARTAQLVARRLTELGLRDVRVDPIPAENRTRYSGWTTMTAWDVDHARCTVLTPQRQLLADWDQIPQHLIMRSEGAQGVFELVAWDGRPDCDLRGKIAFTHQRPAEVQHALQAAGGLGMISDFLPALPGVRGEGEAADHVLWEQVCFRPNPGKLFGFMISPQQGQWLEQLLRRGKVEVEVDIQARNYEGITYAIDALLPADKPSDEELLLVAHLYEPGANDNASGAGLTLEILRAIKQLQGEGKLRLKRSIRVLMAYEGRGTVAWMHRHPRELSRLRAGINLDEVGVDQQKGRSTAHVFLPPLSNPSIATELLVNLCQSLFPTDFRWKAVGDRADIILDTRFSDPNLNVPTPCIIQYPAFAYHTSKDTPEVLSPQVLHAVGLVAAAYLVQLANLGPAEGPALDSLLAQQARETAASLNPQRRGLLRERLLSKQRELARFGITALPQLSAVIASLPTAIPAVGELSRFIPKRTTLASPGGTQAVDLLEPAAKAASRKNMLDHGLDLVFHHFFYWADGQRSLEDICVRIEDELALAQGGDSIPRTTTAKLTHDLGNSLNRAAVLLLYRQLVDAGLMELQERD